MVGQEAVDSSLPPLVNKSLFFQGGRSYRRGVNGINRAPQLL